ncbi:Transcription factor [Aspergillus sclerotialis]|uniref:Transcription factor n=1 Tax=Aspergillus sclerotialis TaxID=2070753 RepID=A0A3A2ZAV4_9EURO|nr:Transcription factor [Aspergillus sclerotialis]
MIPATSSSRKRPGGPLTEVDLGVTESRRRDPKVSRACDSCKAKKIRCSGTFPCQVCTRRSLPCSYVSKYSRGRAPTPPFSIGIPHSEAVPIDSTQDEEAPGVSVPSRRSPTYQSQASYNGEAQRDMAFRSAECSSRPRGSPDLVIDGQYFEPSSGLSFLHRAWAKLLGCDRQMALYESTEREKNQLWMSAGDSPFISTDTEADAILSDGQASRELLGFYFDTCVVTYRMLHRHTVENWLQSVLNDRARGLHISHSVGNPKCAIVLTALAIAKRRLFNIRDDSSTNNVSKRLGESDSLFCTAMELTDSEVGFPRLESAQARLFQVIYLLQTSRMNKAWYTFGAAYQIISTLGLHRRRGRQQTLCVRGNPKYISLQCGRRVFWVAYTIDKYLSVVSGRPRLLHDDEVDQIFPDSVNDEDMMTPEYPGWEPSEECHVDSLIFHAKIARIISRISCEVYYNDNRNPHDRVESAHRLVEELHAWRNSLPPHLGAMKPSTLIPTFRREATALSLAYSHALIHVNRPFLLPDVDMASDSIRVQERVDECISAAKQALSLVDNMAKDPNLFHSFWWTHYVTFCALAVIYIWKIHKSPAESDPHACEHDTLSELIERGQSHLLKACSLASPNRIYGVILDGLRQEMHRQIAKNKITRLIPNAEGVDRRTDGQNNFPCVPSEPNGHEHYAVSTESDWNISDALQSWQTSDWLDLDSSVCLLRSMKRHLPLTNIIKAFYPILGEFELS